MRNGLTVNMSTAILAVIISLSAITASGAQELRSPGAPDAAFGTGGEVIVQPNRACATGCVESLGSQAEALAVAPDGSVLLAGTAQNRGPNGHRTLLVRLNANGTLDRTFGTEGYATGLPGRSCLCHTSTPPKTVACWPLSVGPRVLGHSASSVSLRPARSTQLSQRRA